MFKSMCWSLLLSTQLILAATLAADGAKYKVEIRGPGSLMRAERPAANDKAAVLLDAKAGSGAELEIAEEEHLPIMSLLRKEVTQPADLKTVSRNMESARQTAYDATLADDASKVERFNANKGASPIDSEVCNQLRIKLEKLLLSGSAAPRTIDEFRQDFEFKSFKDGIIMGELWTTDDHNTFVEDCIDFPVKEPPEEHLTTDQNEPLFQGDMVLGTAETAEFLEKQSQKQSFRMPEVKQREMTNETQQIDIHYCFDAGIHPAAKKAFQAAVVHFEKQLPCMIFEEISKRDGEDVCDKFGPSIFVRGDQDSGCWSYLGQVNGELVFGGSEPASLLQGVSWGGKASNEGGRHSLKLNLGKGCETMGMAAHQLGHAVGLVHEIWRSDRNYYVSIAESNIEKAEEEDFVKEGPGSSNSNNVTSKFDLLSLMMWSQHAFSKDDELPTITVKHEPALGYFIGQRMGLSEIDVDHLAKIYGCAAPKPAARSKALSHSLLQGKGLAFDDSCADRHFTGVQYSDGHGAITFISCDELDDQCDGNDAAMKERVLKVCRNTCIQCMTAPRWLVQLRSRTTETTTGKFWQNHLDVSHDNCYDSPSTGIRFVGQRDEAKCQDLHNYCYGHHLQHAVRDVCPMTCGRCQMMQEVDWASNGTGCLDKLAEAKPLFTVAGRSVGCHELGGFCTGHPHSKLVQGKCPKTCGTCSDKAPTSEYVEKPPPKLPWSIEHAPKSETEEGCSRRRRWGFCYSRRRTAGELDA